jgi:xylose isomerase
MFLLVKLLEESGYDGPRRFPGGPDGPDGIDGMDGGEDLWDFVARCMRTYLTLAAKSRRFADDLDIREALEHIGAFQLAEPTVGTYSREAAEQLTTEAFDLRTPMKLDDGNERLDQLVVELLLGLR